MDEFKAQPDQKIPADENGNTPSAERGRQYRAQQRERIARLEADLARAQDEVRSAQHETESAVAVAQAELQARHAQQIAQLHTELAVAQALAQERASQIEQLRTDLAEARKTDHAGQEAKKPKRHYTSIERYDPDLAHQEVLQKWFDYADQHPNPIPPEERIKAAVRQSIAESKARAAATGTPKEPEPTQTADTAATIQPPHNTTRAPNRQSLRQILKPR